METARIENVDELRARLRALRERLDGAFARDTAAPGFSGTTNSTGHCAAVSLILNAAMGADFVSATVSGTSHWFNRFRLDSGNFDADVTGDQFGYPTVQVVQADRLYPGARVRSINEVNAETLARAETLAKRAGLLTVAASLRALERKRAGASSE